MVIRIVSGLICRVVLLQAWVGLRALEGTAEEVHI